MKPLENHPYGGLDVDIERPEEYCCTPKETKQNIRERFDKEYHGLCLGSTQGTSDANKKDLKNFWLSTIDKQLKEQAEGIEKLIKERGLHLGYKNDILEVLQTYKNNELDNE
jgi:5-methylcytosine-specific restriction endonuclease McrBC GTP-binding regulatory subunit McrB